MGSLRGVDRVALQRRVAGATSGERSPSCKKPFLYFYEPENLYQLARQLDLQSGLDIWEPSEHIACMLRPLLIGMGRRMMEFMDWTSE